MVFMHHNVCRAEMHRRVVEVHGEGAWKERMWRNGVCCSKMVWLTCMKSNEVDANLLSRKIWKVRKMQNPGKAGDSQFLNYTKIFQLCFAVRTRKLLQNISFRKYQWIYGRQFRADAGAYWQEQFVCCTTMREETPTPGHANSPNTGCPG